MWSHLIPAVCLVITSCSASVLPTNQPFESVYSKRQVAAGNAGKCHYTIHVTTPANDFKALTVDLGYGVYQGVTNTTTNINSWLG